MTREIIEGAKESIIPFIMGELRHYNVNGNGEVHAEQAKKDLEEIFSLAIKALEQEPTTKNDLGVDCISRDVVKNYIQAHIHEIITESGEDKNKDTNRVLRSMISGVNCMPSVTPQEPRKGQWDIKDKMWWVCSACGCQTRMMKKYNVPNFCPACGADMRGEEK